MHHRLSHTLLHYNVKFQPNIISIFNFLRNYSRRPHLQNKGNMSKKLRSWQMETKSLMGKGVSSSLLLSLQKVEYILGWINKVLCICIKFLLALMHCSSTWMTFSCTTWLKTEVHGKFLFLTLLTKGRNKTLKCLLLLTIRWKLKELKVAAGQKKVARLKENKINPKNGWHVWRSCRWSWIFPSLYTTSKTLKYISRLVPFDLGPWKFIIGWQYNPNSMCLSILHFFTSQLFK